MSYINQFKENLLDNKNRLLIQTTNENFNLLIKKIESIDQKNILYDETVWTFLVVIPYLFKKSDISLLFNTLTKNNTTNDFNSCWVEALPVPPRLKEGNTNLDLAIGDINHRNTNTEKNKNLNGIKYNAKSDGAVCFCEMKWYSDISGRVTNHKKRNQLIRVIENLLCFQSEMNRPTNLYFTLVTPQYFMNEEKPYSRFYSYLMDDYKNPNYIYNDINKTKNLLPFRENYNDNWHYPSDNIFQLIENLKINWISFEDIIIKAPKNEFREYVVKIYNNYCDIKPDNDFMIE